MGALRRQGVLRTKEMVDRFKSVPPVAGQSSPLLVYFGTLLTRGRLNKFESVELAQLVVAQNKKHLLDNWLREVLTAPGLLPAPRLLKFSFSCIPNMHTLAHFHTLELCKTRRMSRSSSCLTLGYARRPCWPVNPLCPSLS